MRREVAQKPGIFAAFAVFLALSGCATYPQQLARGRMAFDQNQHERALALFRDLELDYARLSPRERLDYAYLRGMTDYRMGYHAEARHWLGLAAALDKASHDGLPDDWRTRLSAALDELNAKVYSRDAAALTNDVRMNESKAKKHVVEEP